MAAFERRRQIPFLNMTTDRPWYREPETFVAVAALIVSITAVTVGIYEASLQRRHDTAEVWPHLEISTWVSDSSATLRLENTGLGPAIVKSVDVKVDGKSQHNWDEALRAWYGGDPPPHSSATTFQHALRPGDQTVVLGIRVRDLPAGFWTKVRRITLTVCYASVFDQFWIDSATLGSSNQWREVDHCPAQLPGADL